MNTHHTPGPWELEKSGTKQFIVGWTPLIGGKRLNTICTLPANNEARDANARLIAAAPELLASLIEMCGALEDSNSGAYQTLTDARAAIAKATQS